jgi:hypothetical protein
MSAIDTGISLLFTFGMFCVVSFGLIWSLSKLLKK